MEVTLLRRLEAGAKTWRLIQTENTHHLTNFAKPTPQDPKDRKKEKRVQKAEKWQTPRCHVCCPTLCCFLCLRGQGPECQPSISALLWLQLQSVADNGIFSAAVSPVFVSPVVGATIEGGFRVGPTGSAVTFGGRPPDAGQPGRHHRFSLTRIAGHNKHSSRRPRNA